MERLSGGLSFETYLLSATVGSTAERMVLRREPVGGPLEPYDIRYEAALSEHLRPTDVPVPEVLYLEEDPTVLGRRFVLCEFVDGQIHPHTSSHFTDEAVRESTLVSFVDMLAAIHAVPTAEVPLRPGSGDAVEEVKALRKQFTATELAPRPILQHVFDVLEENAPRNHPRVLVHGDYRLSNLIWRDGAIAAVLDWERAFLGDPMADVAFTLNKALGGWCAIKGGYAKRYSDRTGFDVDPRRLLFWRLVELAKAAVVGMASASAIARGRSADLRLLSVAAVSSAIEPAMVRLADAVSGKAGPR